MFTATASPKGSLSGNRYSAGGAGNQSYGYVISGAPQNTGVTSVDRIVFVNLGKDGRPAPHGIKK